jgi:hypothetical protein
MRRVDASLLLAGLLALSHATAVPALEAGPWRVKRGAEPVDPAEQRPAVQPPPRPVMRGDLGWIPLGPSPTRSAQVVVPPDNLVTGAIHAIAPHPTNAAILYIGAVNGGIWRTANATAANPSWIALSDDLPSQSIGALAFDPTDATRNTLIAGTGRWSNFAQRGDDEIGVYRTTDGGASWAVLGGATLLGRKVSAVAARGAVLLAATTTGLYRSTNTGATWLLASGTGNLPAGSMPALTSDPSNAQRFYAGVLNATPQILRSGDNGASWTDVTTGITGLSASTSSFRIAVGPTGVVYVAVVNGGTLAGVFRSTNQGANWTPMDVPPVHPGGQGVVNTSMVVDPTNPDLVYIAGDRITVSPFTGNVRRGNAAAPAGTQFTTIVDANAGNTTPHADSRAMAFDAAGSLLQADDGGIYRRANPTSSAGTWSSVIGNLNVMEVHDLDHDRVANVILIGTQDNGTHMQQSATNPIWILINGGDGGDVAIDSLSLVGIGSYRYISAQNFGGARRARYNAANAFVSNTNLPTGVTDPQFVTPIEVNVANSGRLLIGGANTLYEINDANAATPTLSIIGAPGANRNAMAYGAAGAPDVAYVGRGSQVFRRNGAAFVATAALPAGAATVTDVALDPANPARVFAIDDNQVFRSIDSGATWTDVTGNLGAISSVDFRSIEFIQRGGGDLVALGTRSGVFFAGVASNSWALLGGGLPDVLVFDLRWIPSQDRLIAGTLGRGVWALDFGQVDALFANGFE